MWLRDARVVAGQEPRPLPWPEVARACPVAFAAAPDHLQGHDRWQRLVEGVASESRPPPTGGWGADASSSSNFLSSKDFSALATPSVLAPRGWHMVQHMLQGVGAPATLMASCNGAGDDWARAFPDPSVSASCTSGLHALWLARHHLPATVLAIDILQATNHRHFEALRVVDADARPFAPGNPGFIPGEAAVRLDVAADGPGVPLAGPVLGSDLALLLTTLPERPRLVIAQGTGPEVLDRQELSALPSGVPVRSLLPQHGHTLGASGLLAVARAAEEAGPVLVVNRALTGACAAVLVGAETLWPQPVWPWGTPGEAPALHHPALRRLAAEAPAHRPAHPPNLLAVHLPTPLSPPPEAALRGALLPSAIREMTPGFAAALLAVRWGFRGPATALVGGTACAMLAGVPDVFCVRVEADGVHWP